MIQLREPGSCFLCGKPRDGGHKSYCKSCLAAYYRDRRSKDGGAHNRYQREWTAANPEKRRAYKRKNTLKQYGLTARDFNALLESQNYQCPICLVALEHEPRPGMPAVAVDHDHVTGKVRGLLCGTCNAAIGLFKDDIATVARVMKYLER